MEQKYIILIPGGFKPPHKGHHKMISDYINNPMVSKVVVFMGSSPRNSDDESLEVTAEQSEKIFNLFGTFSNPKVQLLRAALRLSSVGNKYENPTKIESPLLKTHVNRMGFKSIKRIRYCVILMHLTHCFSSG